MKGFIEVTNFNKDGKSLVRINAIQSITNNIIFLSSVVGNDVALVLCYETYDEIKELINKAQKE